MNNTNKLPTQPQATLDPTQQNLNVQQIISGMDQKHWTIVQDIINLAKIDTSQTPLYLQQLLFLTQKSYDELFLMKYELTLVSLNNFDFLNNFKEIGKTSFDLRFFVTVMAFIILKYLFIIM